MHTSFMWVHVTTPLALGDNPQSSLPDQGAAMPWHRDLFGGVVLGDFVPYRLVFVVTGSYATMMWFSAWSWLARWCVRSRSSFAVWFLGSIRTLGEPFNHLMCLRPSNQGERACASLLWINKLTTMSFV
jgi:hypothetical protein